MSPVHAIPEDEEADIIHDLAEIDPSRPSEMDGQLSCFFCGAWYGPHEANCLWRRARDVYGMPVPDMK